MKKLMIALSLLASTSVFAQIANSKHEIRHQELIEKAIKSKCGAVTNLTELSVITEEIRVDQGIVDKKFETTLSGDFKSEHTFLPHTIRVSSEYADMYDHDSQDWGVYYVTQVSCIYNN